MGIGCKKKTPNQPQTTVQNKSQYQLFPENEAISSPWAWGAARAPSSPPCPHAARGLRPARLFWGGSARGTLHPVGWKAGATRTGNAPELS